MEGNLYYIYLKIHFKKNNIYTVCTYALYTVYIFGTNFFMVNVYYVITIADQSSPSKSGSLPGYGRNGLHRVRSFLLRNLWDITY